MNGSGSRIGGAPVLGAPLWRNAMSRTADEIVSEYARERGWTLFSMYNLVTEHIENQGSNDALIDFLEEAVRMEEDEYGDEPQE